MGIDRKEKRVAIESINLPFLGSRDEDHALFQYLLMDISPNGIKIGIPSWVVNRESLRTGDRINFHIPFMLSRETFDQGEITWTRWDEELKAQLCGAKLSRKLPLNYPVYISFETSDIGIDLHEFSSVENLFFKVIKDSHLLKKGALIYLRHLIPFFSRITQYSREEYPLLKKFFFKDIEEKLEGNIRKLEELHAVLMRDKPLAKDIPRYIDLEELRGMVESEMYLELFNITFGSNAHVPYVRAIKELEKKLYSNYNTIVMLYVRAL